MEISKISKELIASDKIDEVLALLISFTRNEKDAKNDLNDLILLTARYNQVKKQSKKGVISYAEESLEKNIIVNSLLHIIELLGKKTRSVKLQGDNNIIIQGISGSTTYVAGNFQIEEEISNANARSIEKLIQRQSKIKISFLSADPAGNTLRLDKEIRDIETELIRSKFRDKFEFIKFSATRISDLQDSLLNYSPNFVHFSGHGTTAGIALLDNKTDKAHIVSSESLANLFKLFSNDIACVFLNSCYSDSQGRLIKKFIPNVIGMNRAVPDETAIEFAKVFYKAIGAGKEIDFSFEFSKNSLDLNNISGSDIPIIL